jgi:hypothetical protein
VSSRLKLSALLFLVAWAVLPARAAPSGDSAPFVGIWYGVGEPDDETISYIDFYHPDGTYNSEFRKCVRNEVVWRQTASGKWSVRNGVLLMMADKVNDKPDRFDNSYAIELLQPNEFRARLQSNGFLFVEKRIDKFEFPPCYVGA